jgi:hypothetical protein
MGRDDGRKYVTPKTIIPANNTITPPVRLGSFLLSTSPIVLLQGKREAPLASEAG